MHSNVSAFPLLNILYSFLFCGKAKASYLAYKYVVGRMLTLYLRQKCLVCPGAGVGLFAFNNGIGYVNAANAVVFDNAGKRVIEQRGKNPGPTVEVARRVQQAVVGDYLGR